MSKQTSITIRIISIVTLIAFISTQIAFGYEGRTMPIHFQTSHLRSEQAGQAGGIGSNIADDISDSGEHKASAAGITVAPAVGATETAIIQAVLNSDLSITDVKVERMNSPVLSLDESVDSVSWVWGKPAGRFAGVMLAALNSACVRLEMHNLLGAAARSNIQESDKDGLKPFKILVDDVANGGAEEILKDSSDPAEPVGLEGESADEKVQTMQRRADWIHRLGTRTPRKVLKYVLDVVCGTKEAAFGWIGSLGVAVIADAKPHPDQRCFGIFVSNDVNADVKIGDMDQGESFEDQMINNFIAIAEAMHKDIGELKVAMWDGVPGYKRLMERMERIGIQVMKLPGAVESYATFRMLTLKKGDSDRPDVVIGIGLPEIVVASSLCLRFGGKGWFRPVSRSETNKENCSKFFNYDENERKDFVKYNMSPDKDIPPPMYEHSWPFLSTDDMYYIHTGVTGIDEVPGVSIKGGIATTTSVIVDSQGAVWKVTIQTDLARKLILPYGYGWSRQVDVNEVFKNNNPVEVFYGVNSGGQICEMARSNPDVNFIYVDSVNESELLKLAQEAAANDLYNVRFLHYGAAEFNRLFVSGKISRIQVNLPQEKRDLMINMLVNPEPAASKYALGVLDALAADGEFVVITDLKSWASFIMARFEKAGGVNVVGYFNPGTNQYEISVKKTASAAGVAGEASAVGLAGAVSKTAVLMYKAVPYAFSVMLVEQLVLKPGVPNSMRITGAVLSLLILWLGVRVQASLQGPLSRGNKAAIAVTVIGVLSVGGIILHYTAQGADLYHDVRKFATTLLQDCRDRFTTEKSFSVKEQKTLKHSGATYQHAQINYKGPLVIFNYSDDLCHLSLDPRGAVLRLVASEPGTAEPLRRIMLDYEKEHRQQAVVAGMNGGYYRTPDKDKTFYPTGLVQIRKDGELITISEFQDPAGKDPLAAMIVGLSDGRTVIVPSFYYQQRLGPFNGKEQIEFAVQAGPLAVFQGENLKLAERFTMDGGRSLSMAAVDTNGGVHLIVSAGKQGLTGLNYEQAVDAVRGLFADSGLELRSLAFVDGGGSSKMRVEDKESGLHINEGPGYHLIVNGFVVVAMRDIDPVRYISNMLAANQNQEILDTLDYLSEHRTPEEFHEILNNLLMIQSSSRLTSVLSGASQEQLHGLIERSEFRRFLAEAAPGRALDAFRINRALPAGELASNINNVAGFPFRENVRRELAAALRQEGPDSGLILLRGLGSNAMNWLGGLDSILGFCPDEIIAAFSPDVQAAAELISSTKSSKHGKLLIRIGKRSNAGLDLFVRLSEEMRLNHPEYFRLTAQQILLYNNLSVSQRLLEAYYDQYGPVSTQLFIDAGIESGNPRAVQNAAILTERSEKLRLSRPGLAPVNPGEAVNARATGIGLDGKEYEDAVADQENIRSSDKIIGVLKKWIQAEVAKRDGRLLSGDQAVNEARKLLEKLIELSNCSDNLFRRNMPDHMRELPNFIRMLMPDAPPELLIAAMLHDADRFLDGYYIMLKDMPRHDTPQFSQYAKPVQHPRMAAVFAGFLLFNLDIDQATIVKVDALIRNHETGIDRVRSEEQQYFSFTEEEWRQLEAWSRVLSDADAISLFTPQLLINLYIQRVVDEKNPDYFYAEVYNRYARAGEEGRKIIDEYMLEHRDAYDALQCGHETYAVFEQAQRDFAMANSAGLKSTQVDIPNKKESDDIASFL